MKLITKDRLLDAIYFIVGAIIAIACTLLAVHAIYDDVTGVYHMIKNLL